MTQRENKYFIALKQKIGIFLLNTYIITIYSTRADIFLYTHRLVLLRLAY